MAKSIPAIINSNMLKWARENAGYYSVEEASLKIKYPAKKLLAWESGEKQPSVRQVEQLAKFYHCSYSVFSLKTPPEVAPLAKEYRRLPGIKSGAESPELRFALRDMLYRRRIALNLMQELGETLKEFSHSAQLREKPEELALRIRELFNISDENQFDWKNDSEAWKAWRNAVETTGVLVLLFSDVDPEEVRGVSLFHPILPVIGINSREVSASRPFTLIHEFVHVLLGTSSEEKPAINESRSETEWSLVEKFVEHVAGAVLMPEKAVFNEKLVTERTASSEWSIKDVQRLANKYKVTPSAFATRLLFLNRMSAESYNRWKRNWADYLSQSPLKKKSGFATPAQKALNRNGNIFTSLVIEALSYERITPVDASNFLKTNYPHIEELRMYFAFGRPLTANSPGK